MNTHAALCAVMRGVQLPLSMALVESARHHDVHLLIAQQRASQEDGVSGAVLATALRSAAIADLYREYELRRVLGLLAAGGVKALLLKGAALAYTVYAAPHLRPRGDLDLLIAHADLQAADQALLAAGWLRAVEHDQRVDHDTTPLRARGGGEVRRAPGSALENRGSTRVRRRARVRGTGLASRA